MPNYALIKDEKVFNTVVWDGPEVSPIDFGEGVSYVELPEGSSVSIGWYYINGEFVEPPEIEPSPDEMIAALKFEKEQRIIAAANAISKPPLAFCIARAVLGAATEEQKASIAELIAYYDALNALDVESDPYQVEWPDFPSSML